MIRLIFLCSFLFLLTGCFLDQEGKDQSSVEVKISENLVTGAAGGAILYLVNKDLNIQRSVILTDNNINLQLRQGTWDFAIVTWMGDGSANQVFKGAVRCGLQKGVKLASTSESVSLTFAATTCTDSFFTPSTHVVVGTGLKQLQLVNCLDASNPVAGTYCNGGLKGAAQSYKIKLLAKSSPTQKTALGFLGAMNSYVTNPGASGVSSLDSDCIAAATGTNSVNSTTGLYFPFSSASLFISASIEAYSDSSCTTGKQSYIFPSGLGAVGGNASTLTSSVAKTTSTTTSSDLYVAYLSAQLTGNNFFGKVFLSNTVGVTNTFTLTNNTSSTVTLGAPQFTSPSNTEFSLSSSLCSSTLGPSLSCTINVKFLPSNLKGLVSGSLSISVNGVSQSKTLTAFVVPDKFKTFPQGGWASGGSNLPSNKINDVYIEPDSGKKFVATDGGLAIQTGAFGWTIITTKEGLSSNIINTVYAYKVGTTVHVYAGTPSGLSYSNNGGTSFTTLLANSSINDVFAETVLVGSVDQTRVYVGTNDSLKVSADGGVNFTSLSVSGGVHKILVDSSTIYFSNNSSFLSSTTFTVSGGGAVALSTSTLISFDYEILGVPYSVTNAKVSDIIKDGVNIYALVSTGGGVTPALDGLYLLNTNFEHKISIPHLGAAATRNFTGMAVDNNGELFITQKNGGGLYKVTPPANPTGTYTAANISVSPHSTSLNAISIHSDVSVTRFLVGTSSEVLQAQHNGATSPSSLSWGPSNTGSIGSLSGGGLPNNWVNAFGFWAPAGNYIVGTKEGLAVTQNNWSSRYIWLPSEEITAMTIKGTDVYYTSKVGGVTKVYSSPLSTTNTAPNPLNSSLSGPINDIFVTNTTLYLASSLVGVYHHTLGGSIWPTYQASPIGPLLSNNVRNVWVDNTGNIYLTYGNDDYNPFNINCYSCQVGKITPSASPTINHVAGISVVPGNIKKFYVDPTGQVFVTTDNGLIKKWASLSDLDSNVTPTTISIGSFSSPPSINDIVVKSVAGSNNIYVATSRGLFISLDNGATWTEKNAATHGLPTNNVKKIQVDAQNDVYISTTGAEGAASGGGFAKTN